MLIAGLLASCAEQQPQPAGKGAETRRAVINMKEIAEQEKSNPPAKKPPKVVHEPLPGPQEGGLLRRDP
jgi:hypothetical protein